MLRLHSSRKEILQCPHLIYSTLPPAAHVKGKVDKFLISNPAVRTTRGNSCPCQKHQLIHQHVNAGVIDRLHILAE